MTRRRMGVDPVSGKLYPETDRERAFRLMALTYVELRNQVCEKDRVQVDRAFTSATFEAMRIEPANVDEREVEFKRRYAKYVPQQWIQ